ncbi:Eco57I restriction-modification methylase domain-containing protein [Chryseobacterium sp. CT-SW4]|uniref:Eco57I restriction-modification methylase domain-containing protein n=1 Tax=Chryseobacterium sp. SW-1 TaxID=3157343 RepID=UPI003B02E203
MVQNLNIDPINNELPSIFADRLGIIYAKQVNLKHKKDYGQFFTPTSIVQLMASYSNFSGTSVKILDPGCGTAILSCGLIEHLINTSNIKVIHLVTYEIDSEIIPFSKIVLEYLKYWLLKKNIKFKYTLNNKDFILSHAEALKKNYTGDKFNIIISNPPYFKLSKNDSRTRVAVDLVSGQPNIYSLFMGIAANLLSEKGELIFITPRSFASGNYFRAFRNLFFNTVQIDKIHLFDSRKDTFTRDNVLQETVIIKATKIIISPNKPVLLSSSRGINDIFTPKLRYYNFSELIDMESKEKILHIPINEKEENIMQLVKRWKNTLSDYNIQISTGPVVSFRSKEYLKENYEKSLAPLFWLHNVNKMVLEWPLELKNKEQFIEAGLNTKSILIPNKNYILLRRFSTKDDNSRLIAAPYFSNYITSNVIGVENKVNYIYRKNGYLERSETIGLCALLNSHLFDTYFQIFNGNVNVSATELREMKLPPLEIIKNIGNKIILSNDYSMQNVNYIVNKLLN